MLDLNRFFRSPYSDEGLSIDELTTFGSAQLAAMIANNPGHALDTLIAATDTVLTALGSSVSDETVRLGLQKARTQAKETFRLTLSNELSKIHGAALAQYGRKGATMLELFPEGLTIFSTATDSELQKKLNALEIAVGKKAELDADTKALAHTLATTWTSLYGQATTGKAGTGSAADQRRQAVNALRAQLFQNLLALAARFPDQMDKAALYCPQHLLENPTRTFDKAGDTTTTIPPKQ